MKKIDTNKNGHLSTKDVNYFGGQYSFFEKLKMKGIGSPKIIYDSGVQAFDELNRNVAGEVGFVNFELLKNGLVLRLNMNQRFSCIGMRLTDLNAINLIGYRIELKQKKYPGEYETKIVHRGELEIVETKEVLKFSVLVKDFKQITNYFEKKELIDKFNFSISAKPPEKDFGYLLDMVEAFIE